MIPAVPLRVRDIASKIAFMVAPFVAIGALYLTLFQSTVPPLMVILMVGVFVLSCIRLKIPSGHLADYRSIFAALSVVCVILLISSQPMHDRIMIVAVGLVLLGLALEREDA